MLYMLRVYTLSMEIHVKKGNIFLSLLRFLNKACVIRNPEKDLDGDGLAKDPWRLCTIKQVEEQKGLIRVIPIWSTGIVIAATLNQHALPVLQANTMDRHLIGSLRIPAGSYGVFGLLTLFLWVAIYDRKLVPLLAKLTGRPRGLSNEQRMGIGILISCIATATAGVVENKRRATALRQGLADHPRAVVDMSANWLLPQHCLVGLAEALSTIGQIDFFYSQFPKSMKSIAMALLALGAAVGDLVASLIIGIVSDVTKRGGRVSWLSNNLNKGHYDYYYWLLSLLNVANFFYYLLCSRAFGNEDEKEYDDGEAMEEVEMHPCSGSPIRRVGV